MKIGIFESIMTPAGHEIDFDRMLVNELVGIGHDVSLYVPQNYVFKYDYGVPVHFLPGQGVSYEGVSGLKKAWLSAKREFNRQRWFKTLYEYACNGQVDAIIVPTATYRYLRAVNINAIRKSPIPVIFVMHGINPKEAPKFFKEMEKLQECPNINAAALLFTEDVFGKKLSKVHCIKPPVFTPRDIEHERTANDSSTAKLTLGFFGQYRKEKNLDVFLDTLLSCNIDTEYEMIIQGATVKPEDAADFARIEQKYKANLQLEFWHKALIGQEWQQAIASVDALIMPYSATRYRYHWSAMLFTAIGFNKPVVAAADINPEVFEKYAIGLTFPASDNKALQNTLEQFINTYNERKTTYASELARANQEYSPRMFAQKLVEIASNVQ
ncbi:glycosyltransferase [Sporomusa sp.]|uniref:glycosyltransferase n=1 Tax=Sporomusa sp. TaxID=2078658 RepID=UPI002CF377BF|nr:glycosyltransferase [Sporomusa sp.]HWR44304.1 glycosyltransferase [Sporomusa sp.]